MVRSRGQESYELAEVGMRCQREGESLISTANFRAAKFARARAGHLDMFPEMINRYLNAGDLALSMGGKRGSPQYVFAEQMLTTTTSEDSAHASDSLKIYAEEL